MEHALLVLMVAPLLLKQEPQLPIQLLNAYVLQATTLRMAQLAPRVLSVWPIRTKLVPQTEVQICAWLVIVPILLTVPVLLAALQLISACAQPTPMEMMRMEHALLVPIVASLLLKQKPQL